MAAYADVSDKQSTKPLIRVEDIRRMVQSCVDRGEIHVVLTDEGYTIYHHYRGTPTSKEIEMPIAQLRPADNGLYQIHWRRGSGRWWLYHDSEERPFIAHFERCIEEITKDPWGCFWG
jgi:hypothetical protein